jgi:hypothetical protein
MDETIIHGKGDGSNSRRILVVVLVGLIIIACIVLIGAGLILRNRQMEATETGEPAEAGAAPDTLPPPPSGIHAVMSPIYDVPLGWNDNSDNEDGFNVYRRRIDILGSPEPAGLVGEDETEFTDEDVTCGATYQYTVASYNTAGESPATECWQITLPPCPTPRAMRLGIGAENGRGFLTGALGEEGDFYLDVGEDGRLMFLADLPGQMGLVDLGDVGDNPLHQVTMPPDPLERNGIPAILGHIYVAMARDGMSFIVFTLTELGDPVTLEYIIYYPNTEIIDLTPCERLGGRTPGGPCVSGDGVCDPNCTVPDPERIGTTVPEDEPDDFEDYYGAAAAQYPGGALFTPMSLPTGQTDTPPPLADYPEPTYTERDEDCGNQPCISGDGICSPDCGEGESFRQWDDDRICDEGGPDYATAAPPYTPCEGGGEGGTPGEAYATGMTTADRTGRYVDTDCGEPCVTGDGICDPTCTPNDDDTLRASLACFDEDGDGQPDGCTSDRGETEPPGQPVETPGRSLLDGDCGGPCVEDGVCIPYCDPYFSPSANFAGTTPMTYDPDCGPPCDPEDDPCLCTPVTRATAMFAEVDWEAECAPPGCPEDSPCFNMGPGYPCRTPNGAAGVCRDCECVPTGGCPEDSVCATVVEGGRCTDASGAAGTCQNCECVPTTTTGGCPEDSPCFNMGPGYPCTTAAGGPGTCQNCECVPQTTSTGCPADSDNCTQDSDCWDTTAGRDIGWHCRECVCYPPCIVNGVCEPNLGENIGNCAEDCHVCGDGFFSPAGGEQCDPSANILCPQYQRCDNCTRCREADCHCDGTTYVCNDDVNTRIENDSRCYYSTGGTTP